MTLVEKKQKVSFGLKGMILLLAFQKHTPCVTITPRRKTWKRLKTSRVTSLSACSKCIQMKAWSDLIVHQGTGYPTRCPPTMNHKLF